METRQGSVVGYLILAALVVLVLFVVGMLVNARRVVSPVPDEGAIKIIYISPSPTGTILVPSPLKAAGS
jgi:hypothetical protein